MPDGKDSLAAGDLGRGGANRERSEVGISVAHPLVAFSTAVAIWNAGEPEESGGDQHG